ncbi:MAG: hypothetical protein HKN77_01655 [Woeseiaceae bacterium]|nr:hypothetical protein [Woeseiaceae bacterium]
MAEQPQRTGRVQVVLIATVFFGPLLLAAWLYYGGSFFQPAGRANHGALLEPIVNIVDEVPATRLYPAHDGKWLLLYQHDGACLKECREALYTIRQLRLMLGREMERVVRIFLHDDTPLDTVFPDAEHEGLVTLNDPATSALIKSKKPGELQAGGYYLVDPQGNLVMYFHAGLPAGEIVDDIKRLLRLSRIG